MRAAAFTSIAAAQAFQALADKALGLPVDGVDVGGGAHAPSAQSRTLHWADPEQHPVSGAWLHRIGNAILRARIDPARLIARLTEAEIEAFAAAVDAATDDGAIDDDDPTDPAIPVALAARVVLLSDDGSGSGPGDVPGFTIRGTFSIGGFASRQYERDSDGARFVVQRVASGGTPKRWLVVVWAPAASRVAAAGAFVDFADAMGANVTKSWAVALSGSQLTVPALDGDNTAVGNAVKAVWPAAWTTSGGAPRFIGAVLP